MRLQSKKQASIKDFFSTKFSVIYNLIPEFVDFDSILYHHQEKIAMFQQY